MNDIDFVAGFDAGWDSSGEGHNAEYAKWPNPAGYVQTRTDALGSEEIEPKVKELATQRKDDTPEEAAQRVRFALSQWERWPQSSDEDCVGALRERILELTKQNNEQEFKIQQLVTSNVEMTRRLALGRDKLVKTGEWAFGEGWEAGMDCCNRLHKVIFGVSTCGFKAEHSRALAYNTTMAKGNPHDD